MKLAGVFLGCAAAGILFFMYTRAEAADAANTYTYKAGDVEVHLLSEGQSDGNGSNHIGANDATMGKYAPDGTYPTAVNTFLVRSQEGLVLIDTGFGRELFDNLKKLGVEAGQIDAVLLTHMHGDHIGGLLVNDKIAFPKAKLYLAQQERDYWASEKIMKTFPEDRRSGFKNAQKVLETYGGAVQTFSPNKLGAKGAALLPGIEAIAAFGHTPGHTLYEVTSGESKLLIWGDLTHAMAIQMPVPEVAMTYDVDPEMAVAARLAVLEYVADNNIPIAGMHVPYPGTGKVAPASEGGYAFTPAP
jgi:glyoxylase-like metal-dependent hydrolase (beta-lactamase superfamily II)